MVENDCFYILIHLSKCCFQLCSSSFYFLTYICWSSKHIQMQSVLKAMKRLKYPCRMCRQVVQLLQLPVWPATRANPWGGGRASIIRLNHCCAAQESKLKNSTLVQLIAAAARCRFECVLVCLCCGWHIRVHIMHSYV